MTINDFLNLDLCHGQIVDVLVGPGLKGKGNKYTVRIDFGGSVGSRWADLPAGRPYDEAWLRGSPVICLVNRRVKLPRRSASQAVVVLGVHPPESLPQARLADDPSAHCEPTPVRASYLVH